MACPRGDTLACGCKREVEEVKFRLGLALCFQTEVVHPFDLSFPLKLKYCINCVHVHGNCFCPPRPGLTLIHGCLLHVGKCMTIRYLASQFMSPQSGRRPQNTFQSVEDESGECT